MKPVYSVRSALVRVAGMKHGAVRASSDVATVAREYLETLSEAGSLPAIEVVLALYVDGKHKLVAIHEVSRGTLSTSLVHPRDVFGPALRLGTVAALMLVHNHPSGDPEPSMEDVKLTERIVESGALLGLPLLDHVVIAGIGPDAAHVSLRDRYSYLFGRSDAPATMRGRERVAESDSRILGSNLELAKPFPVRHARRLAIRADARSHSRQVGP